MKQPAKSIFNSPTLKSHWTRKHNSMRPKLPFDSIQEAQDYIIKHNIPFKYKPYLCSVCNKYHIGH